MADMQCAVTVRDQYARAREEQADHYFQEIIDIADNATPETVNVARLRVDSRNVAGHAIYATTGGGPIAFVGFPVERDGNVVPATMLIG